MPIAALLRDLKQRGLLEDTLVVWTTEFGRMPFTQGATGRDHNGGTFVTWLAGPVLQGWLCAGLFSAVFVVGCMEPPCKRGTCTCPRCGCESPVSRPAG